MHLAPPRQREVYSGLRAASAQVRPDTAGTTLFSARAAGWDWVAGRC